MEAVTGADGWYRCSVFGHTSSANAYVRISLADADNSLTLRELVAVLFSFKTPNGKGLVSTPYIETGATTAKAGILEDMPRIDYTSGSGAFCWSRGGRICLYK